MYRNEFENKFLSKQKIPQAILLYGDSTFLIDYYIKKIFRILQPEEEELSRIYFDEYSTSKDSNESGAKKLQMLLGTQSLFCSRSIVILKLEHKIPKKELTEILAKQQKNSQSFFIFAFYHAENRDSKLYANDCREMEQVFSGHSGISVRFFQPNPKESMVILREMSQELNLLIEDRFLMEIFHLQNGDLSIIYSDLAKLSTLQRRIEAQDIHHLIYGVASWSIEDLCLALFQKENTLTILQHLLEEGESGRSIIVGIEVFFMRLFLTYSYGRVHGEVNFLEILGFRPPIQIEQQYSHLSLRLSEMQYRKIFEVLQKSFLNLLQRDSHTERELLCCLIEIQAIF
ncbi:hypothetical protein CCZ01_07310 [Helicobacter monodelphidis]|uniref:hypothetical protein n=1 Tax=Helicobacter sp. 15-1451 TaxID=2004995 RepID=UPI000DCD72E3|nr:hypothetical protein [Helicobacter sp. 15-1451]RAX57144.1 hypothetical protein CCZ01_07310 [Helicobacter sp. 15-1451]